MKICLAALVLGLLVTPAFAVSELVFSTQPQTVGLGAISEKMIVSSGDAVGETADLSLNSSSVTGEFSSSNTNWQAVAKMTWNSNWSNRTFYYRDSTEGVHTISVTLTTRNSGESRSTSQVITIGDASDLVLSANSVESVDEQVSPVTASQSTSNTAIKVNIGNRQIAAVNSPVNFKVRVTGVKKGDSIEHDWSFGDGATGMGPKVVHFYEYPGVYNVVLNTRRVGDFEEATTKTEVEVIAPEVIISEVAGDGSYVKLTNNSVKMVNLGFWKLSSGDKNFILPRDTMIGPRASLFLSRNVTLLPVLARQVRLLYPTGTVFTTYNMPGNIDQGSPELKQTLEKLKTTIKPEAVSSVVAEKILPVTSISRSDQVGGTIILGKDKEKSWWQKIFSR